MHKGRTVTSHSDQTRQDSAIDSQGTGGKALTFVEGSDKFDRYIYGLTQVLYCGRTKYQEVKIADTYNYGRILALDGAIQSAAADEALYHELLVQPAMLFHPQPRDVLIIGGGEGASLREVLAHRTVQTATMVDLDRELVELCREHLRPWHLGSFSDPRARLVFEDGRRFVENHETRYDVVIADVVDMLDNGPAQALYTRQFYHTIRSRLRDNGILAVQALELDPLTYEPHATLGRTVRTAFPEVHSYRAHIPSFLGSWGFLIASDWLRPQDCSAERVDEAIQQKLGDRWLQHLSGRFLMACFDLCQKTERLLQLPGPIIEDGAQFVPPPEIVETTREFGSFPALPGQPT